MIILPPEDYKALLDRQTLINVKRFELDMFQTALNFTKQQIFAKNGLDPNAQYSIDERGVVTPLAPSVPEPGAEPAP